MDKGQGQEWTHLYGQDGHVQQVTFFAPVHSCSCPYKPKKSSQSRLLVLIPLFSKLCEINAVHHVGEQGVFSTTVGEFFDFLVMGEGSRLHAGEPPALHIASD